MASAFIMLTVGPTPAVWMRVVVLLVLRCFLADVGEGDVPLKPEVAFTVGCGSTPITTRRSVVLEGIAKNHG